MGKLLTEKQIKDYQENGFLIVKNFLDDQQIDILQAETRKIIQGFDLQDLKIFTTDDQNKHTDAYFLESGDKVRCFFEEGAIDKDGNLSVEKALAINKIGHAMHDLIPAFEKISYTESLLSTAKQIGLGKASIVQSQYIFKQPKIGAKVNAHTDSTFIYTEPLSCVGVWIALEDATEENGCLMAISGSHKISLKDRFIRNKENTGTEFVSLEGEREEWPLHQMQALPVKKGDMILIHGQVVHASFANKSQKSRHAFVLHLVDLDCNWPSDNWLQRSKELPFRLLENVVSQRF